MDSQEHIRSSPLSSEEQTSNTSTNFTPKTIPISSNPPIPSQHEIDFNTQYENDSEKPYCYKEDPTFTKLHFAAKINDEKMAEILISEGVDINETDIIYQILKILF